MTKAIELAIKEKENNMKKKELQLLIYQFNSEASKVQTRYRVQKINRIVEKIKKLKTNYFT